VRSKAAGSCARPGGVLGSRSRPARGAGLRAGTGTALALALGVVIVAGGCGGGSGPAGSSSPVTAHPSGTAIVYGLGASETGSASPRTDGGGVTFQGPVGVADPPITSGAGGGAGGAGAASAAPTAPSPGTPGSGASLDGPGTPLTAYVVAASSPEGMAVDAAYSAWLSDLSNYYDTFLGQWTRQMQQVATPDLIQAAIEAARSINAAGEHGTGTLVDSARQIEQAGSTVVITDCLDEYHWYLVFDGTGEPDPHVARGYFEGTANLVEQDGRWLVEKWIASQKPCTP
jgi:hypothetical protein